MIYLVSDHYRKLAISENSNWFQQLKILTETEDHYRKLAMF